jgi:heavy metal sensor kinase
MIDSVRVKLTLWYLVVLALVLIAFSAVIYALLRQSLYERLDAGLRVEIRAMSAALDRELAAGATEQEAFTRVLEERTIQRQATAIYDIDGRALAERPTRSGKHARLPALQVVPADNTYFYTITEEEDGGRDGRRIGVRRVRSETNGTTYIYAVSQPLDRVVEELSSLQKNLLLAIPLALALAGGGGWFLARRGLGPVVSMSEQARRIGAANLGERLPIANPRDELGQLATTFNQLLERLDGSFEQQRRFMADASHELRTPLSVLRTTAAVALERERTGQEYRDALGLVGEQARRLTRIVEEMFTLARADAGQPSLQPSDFYLEEVVAESARAAAVLGARKGVVVEMEEAQESPCRGDEGLLRQMFLNLLDNAIKHTPPGGNVRVSLNRNNSHYTVAVADTGSGIPPDAQAHVFERFFRADKSRSQSESAAGSGAGLGLAIARWVAEAHGGTLELQLTSNTGSTFVATLPTRNC